MDKKNQYIEKLKLLIDGKLSERELSEWAEREETDNPELDENSQEVLDALQLSGALNEAGRPLYIKEDYESWLREFEAKM